MLQTKGMPKEALLNLIDSSVTGKTVYQEDIAALFQTYGDTYTYGYTDERKPGTLGWMKAQPQKELSNQAAPVEVPEGGMRYDYPQGYIHTYSAETEYRRKHPKFGTFYVKFDICQRDDKLTKVHTELTLQQVREIQAEIERQGNTML